MVAHPAVAAQEVRQRAASDRADACLRRTREIAWRANAHIVGKKDPPASRAENRFFAVEVDEAAGSRHRNRRQAGHVADVTEGNSLLHGEETVVFADAGCQGVDKRLDAKPGVRWQVAMRPGKRKKRDEANSPIDVLIDKIEKLKARIRGKVEHPFRVLKRQFGYVKVRYRGLKKNTLQLKTLFALSNLWMVRHRLMATQG